jgi:hypothetical protein
LSKNNTMKIRFAFLFLALTFVSFTTFSQLNLETRIGGSNFIGASINVSKDFLLSNEKPRFLTTSIGIGTLYPEYGVSEFILHLGLNHQFKNLGYGIELSYYDQKLFTLNDWYNEFVDFLTYPNVNYTFYTKTNFYLKLSFGAYFAFSRFPDKTLYFEGDPIPGGGITVGYHLLKKK